MLECGRCAMGVDRVLSFADALWPSFLTARARQLDHEHRARAAVVRADEYLSRNVVVSADQDHVLAAPGTDATTLAIGSRPCGVVASKASTRTETPSFRSSATMYLRARAAPGDPACRGPMATSRSRWRSAAAPSNTARGRGVGRAVGGGTPVWLTVRRTQSSLDLLF
jgi:hypothetical protein